MKISDIDHNTKEALRIIDSFVDCVAVATWANQDTLNMAMDYLGDALKREDDGCQVIFKQFVEYLRQHRDGEL